MKSKFLLSVILACFLGACGAANDNEAADSAGNKEAGDETAITNEENKNNENEVSKTEEQANENDAEQTTDIMMVELKNGEDKKVGTAELKQEAEGVVIKLEASDLPPGTHGFHIHEAGKCEAPTFESAGGHFNPTNANHGFDDEKGPHAGDLPNLEVGEDGTVDIEVVAENVTLLADEPNSLLGPEGTALVIHAEADDGKSQPAGNAGDRIVCGVIGE